MAKEKTSFIQPILDIPKTLKGFPKNLKGDPKNAAEFEQCKKEHKSYMWLASIPLIAGVIMTVLQIGESVATILAIVGLLALILLLYRMNHIKNFVGVQIGDLTCPNCKEMITYDENVQYDTTSVNWRVHSSKSPVKRNEETSPMNVSAQGTQTADITITCKCQKCGTPHSFDKSFVVGECYKRCRDVSYREAELVKIKLEEEVRKVSRAVFENGEQGDNDYGVSVKCYSLDATVKDYFNV